jgi:hypothetical protein
MDKYKGEKGALKCLNDFGEVAFINLESYQSLSGNNFYEAHKHLFLILILNVNFFKIMRRKIIGSFALPRKRATFCSTLSNLTIATSVGLRREHCS